MVHWCDFVNMASLLSFCWHSFLQSVLVLALFGGVTRFSSELHRLLLAEASLSIDPAML